jgi:hypothetical protein
MTLEELVNSTSGFTSYSDADKIRFFAWFLHSKRGKERFQPSDIRGCYDELDLQQPSSISSFLFSMNRRKPKQVLHNRSGYALEKRVRDELEAKFGKRPASIAVDKLLTDLPVKVPNLPERSFLNEALTCYRSQAFRAAIVMSWNLAYDHLCSFVLAKKLAEFNAQYPLSYPNLHAKAKMKAVVKRDDFEELKESEVIQICRSANIVTSGVFKVLNEKLGKRNSYAHPSNLTVTAHTAEEVILDLVNNVVLKLVI